MGVKTEAFAKRSFARLNDTPWMAWLVRNTRDGLFFRFHAKR
jgi:hypothetical protein